jgi:hypothetical protein
MMWFPEEMKKDALGHTEWIGFYLSLTILMNCSSTQVTENSTTVPFFHLRMDKQPILSNGGF